MLESELSLSTLPKTWFIDIDGTLLVHNGYKDGRDEVIESSRIFLQNIPNSDKIILVTSRDEKYRQTTVDFLKNEKIRFDEIIFNLPFGERILINDAKPTGLKTSYAVNVKRDEGIGINVSIDDSL